MPESLKRRTLYLGSKHLIMDGRRPIMTVKSERTEAKGASTGPQDIVNGFVALFRGPFTAKHVSLPWLPRCESPMYQQGLLIGSGRPSLT